MKRCTHNFGRIKAPGKWYCRWCGAGSYSTVINGKIVTRKVPQQHNPRHDGNPDDYGWQHRLTDTLIEDPSEMYLPSVRPQVIKGVLCEPFFTSMGCNGCYACGVQAGYPDNTCPRDKKNKKLCRSDYANGNDARFIWKPAWGRNENPPNEQS